MRYVLAFVVAIAVCGCSPDSLRDHRQEGQAISRRLIHEMRAVTTRQELVEALPGLESLFEELVDVMISARQRQEEEVAPSPLELTERDHQLSAALRTEMERLYQLEGGRDLIESAQRESLSRLDTFEYQLSRRKQLAQ